MTRDCNTCQRHQQGKHPEQAKFWIKTADAGHMYEDERSCMDCLMHAGLLELPYYIDARQDTKEQPKQDQRVPRAPSGVALVHNPEQPRQADPQKAPSERQVGGSHYKGFAIQPWHFCMVNGLDFATSSVIKYVCRKKGDRAKQIEDLKKAIHNIEMKIEMLEKEQASEP